MSAATQVSEELVPAEGSKQVTAKSGSNFALAFFFLPRERREGITHFYALSRLIDDAVDDHPAEEGARLLQYWREEIALCYDGTPRHPVTLEMQGTIRRFDIPKRYLDLLVEGCEMDLKKNRYESFQDLYQYCFRVAGVIGLICMKIFGLSGDLAEQAAEELGIALQLTNILRDVKADSQIGRVYLPQEDLKLYKIAEADLHAGKLSPNMKRMLKLTADRAQYYFDLAFTKMKKLPRRPLIAAWIMGRVYRDILRKIRKKDYDVFAQKVRVSKPKKLAIALRTFAGL